MYLPLRVVIVSALSARLTLPPANRHPPSVIAITATQRKSLQRALVKSGVVLGSDL